MAFKVKPSVLSQQRRMRSSCSVSGTSDEAKEARVRAGGAGPRPLDPLASRWPAGGQQVARQAVRARGHVVAQVVAQHGRVVAGARTLTVEVSATT